VLLQLYCWTAVPFAMLAAFASTHLPLLLLAAVYVEPDEIAVAVAAEVTAAAAEGGEGGCESACQQGRGRRHGQHGGAPPPC
jgi:hypothetical protein